MINLAIFDVSLVCRDVVCAIRRCSFGTRYASVRLGIGARFLAARAVLGPRSCEVIDIQSSCAAGRFRQRWIKPGGSYMLGTIVDRSTSVGTLPIPLCNKDVLLRIFRG